MSIFCNTYAIYLSSNRYARRVIRRGKAFSLFVVIMTPLGCAKSCMKILTKRFGSTRRTTNKGKPRKVGFEEADNEGSEIENIRTGEMIAPLKIGLNIDD